MSSNTAPAFGIIVTAAGPDYARSSARTGAALSSSPMSVKTCRASWSLARASASRVADRAGADAGGLG
jgi:hypothetical protein